MLTRIFKEETIPRLALPVINFKKCLNLNIPIGENIAICKDEYTRKGNISNIEFVTSANTQARPSSPQNTLLLTESDLERYQHDISHILKSIYVLLIDNESLNNIHERADEILTTLPFVSNESALVDSIPSISNELRNFSKNT